VYPFFSEVFSDTDPGATAEHQTLPRSKSPLGRNPLGALTAPWHVTMHPERFGGRGHQLGVLLLAAVPGLLFARRLHGLGTLLAVGLVYCVLWYLLRQNVRFLLPVVPLLSTAAVWVWIEMRRFPALPRLAAGATFAAILAAYAAVPLVRCGDQLAVAFGWESREDYLLRHEPTWQAADVRVTRESVYRRRTHYDRKITDPAQFSRTLREAGFTHLLLAENVGDGGIQYDPTLSRLAEAQCSAGAGDSLLKLADYRFYDPDGGVRRYRLVMLR